MLPNRTATTATRPGAGYHRVQVGERAADHQPVTAPPPDGELGDQAGVDLERVGAGVERVAEQGAADQHDREVGRGPQPHRAELGRVGVDQLEPDERVEAHGGRPVPEPFRVLEDATLGVAPREPGEREVDRADRADRLPDRPEQQGERDQPDPPPDVEHAEEGVRRQVLAQHGRHGGVRRDDEADDPQRAAEPRRVDDGREPRRGEPAAGRCVVPRVAPRDGQDRERDRERGHRPGDRELGRDGQVLGPADAVGEGDAVRGQVSGLRAGRSSSRACATRPRPRPAARSGRARGSSCPCRTRAPARARSARGSRRAGRTRR